MPKAVMGRHGSLTHFTPWLAETFGLDEVSVLPPIARPGKVLCAGINYKSHLDENPAARMPDQPFFFSKLPSVIIGQGNPIIHNPRTRQLDWEVELAAVIGRTARRLQGQSAVECVAGYTVLNDVSARDVQFKDQQITLGKNFDTFAPMGPCLATPDELPDLENVRLRSWVNDELMQDGSTADMIFSLAELLVDITSILTLEPGDVVSTGTPSGVGIFRQPQVFLKAGDVVRVEVEGIGRLVNPVVEWE
jgi:2-keto-4-pentenoate hydratase/2-oxohepta-3-ene-1,7-dioic acid hydratase in catechol pathway